MILLVPPLSGRFGGTRQRMLRVAHHDAKHARDVTRSWDAFRRQRAEVVRSILASATDAMTIGSETIRAKWIRESWTRDAHQDLGAVTSSCLIVSGSKDLLCPPPDRRQLGRRIAGPLASHITDNMTHALAKTTERPRPATSSRILQDQWNTRQLAPEVRDAIHGWVTTWFKA